MASVKVLKPTQPVNLLNTPIAPKPYTLSYYEWLETQGQDFNIDFQAPSGGIATDFLLATLTNKEVLFIKSFSVSAFALIGESGQVNLNFKNLKLDLGFINLSPTAIEVPYTITKTYSTPLKINGSEFIQLRTNCDYYCAIEINGFIVDKSLLFF